MVGDGERWKQGDFTDFALVSDGQRWWAMSQVVLQLSGRAHRSSAGLGTGRGPKNAPRRPGNDVAEAPLTPANSPIHARRSFGTGRGRQAREILDSHQARDPGGRDS